MIWPVAGVLFGAVAAIANLVIKSKKRLGGLNANTKASNRNA